MTVRELVNDLLGVDPELDVLIDGVVLSRRVVGLMSYSDYVILVSGAEYEVA